MDLKQDGLNLNSGKKTDIKNSISANSQTLQSMKTYESASVKVSYDKRKRAVKVKEGRRAADFFMFNDAGVTFELSNGTLKVGTIALVDPPISRTTFPVSATVIPSLEWDHENENLIVGSVDESEGKTVDEANVFIGVDLIRGNLGVNIKSITSQLSIKHSAVSSRIA